MSRGKRITALLSAVIIIAGALAAIGCGSSGSSSTSGSGGSKAAVKVAVLMPALSTTYYNSVLKGVKEGVEKEGNTSYDILNANYDPQQQATQCQTAISQQKYQGILIDAVDGASMVPCAESAVKAGIKVVAMDGPIGPSWETSKAQVKGITGSSYPLAQTNGARLAQLAQQACAGKNPCNLLYQIGNPAFSYDTSLLDNFKKNLPSNVTIADEVQTNFNPDDGRTQTTNALQAHSDLNVIITEDTTAQGVVPAVAEAGKNGKVLIVSDGGSAYATTQVKSGGIFGTVATAPIDDGRNASTWAIQAARGEHISGSTFIDSIKDLTPPLVTKQTASQWTPQY